MEGLGVALRSRATVTWFPMLMPNDKDSNSRFDASIDDEVREDTQRKDSAPFRRWCAEARVLDHKVGNSLEFGEKALRYSWPGVLGVEVKGVSNVLFSAGMK